MEEVYNYLIDFGFKREDIDEIVNNYSLNEITPTNLLRHIKSNCEYLLEFGYTEMQIIKMAKIFPMLFGCSIENIKRKIEDIESLGYSKKEVIIMTIKLPSLFGYNFESIKQKIEYLISLGYTREQVIKIIKVFPSILSLSIENIKQKKEDLISLGYTNNEAIKLTTAMPPILALSMKNIKQKIGDIMSLGYTQEEAKKMTLELPALFGLSFGNIANKINYYREIDLDYYVTEHPKNLMQSVELSYARYNYFKSNNIEMKSCVYLFYNERDFKKQFGITKQELLQMYPYKRKEEEIKDAR